jgi:hypothetical protein
MIADRLLDFGAGGALTSGGSAHSSRVQGALAGVLRG